MRLILLTEHSHSSSSTRMTSGFTLSSCSPPYESPFFYFSPYAFCIETFVQSLFRCLLLQILLPICWGTVPLFAPQQGEGTAHDRRIEYIWLKSGKTKDQIEFQQWYQYCNAPMLSATCLPYTAMPALPMLLFLSVEVQTFQPSLLKALRNVQRKKSLEYDRMGPSLRKSRDCAKPSWLDKGTSLSSVFGE